MDDLTKNERSSSNTSSPSPLGLGILGGLTGAAIGAVAAIYLSDKRNRDQLQKQVVMFREKVIKVMDSYSEQEKKTDEISDKLDDIEDNVHTIQK